MSTRTPPEIPSDLSRLDAPQRLRAFDVPLMTTEPDAELQRLVTEASEVSGFPIALVSLVASRVQFFRAQVGLPPDLEASRATDRCSSLCQFVVAGDKPLLVEDAAAVPALPSDLVQRYGIRAYVGFPLRVAGQTVGSFCVIDVKPGTLAPGARERLEALAQAASARLETLAATLPPPEGPAEAKAQQAWLSLAETQPLLSLGERFANGQLSLEEFQRALGALAGLSSEPR
ncbi:MAG TPA: GAF domain-containing protein [Myxococcus sp.]|nr:GAF domain-containing protein [Myxococcus sp.]